MASSLNRKLAYLVQASIALNSASDTRAVLRYLLRVATEVLDCEGASILLYDERQRRLFFVAATGAQNLERIAVPLDRSIAGEVFRTGNPLVVSRVEQDPRHFSQVSQQAGMQVRSLLAVPLMARGRKVGVLEALNKRRGSFTTEDLRLARILAAQAGVAIHNVHMMEDMRQAYAALEHAKRVREEALALASHELRTPLGIILGYAALLQQDTQGPQTEFAQAILDAALQMRAIVEEMGHFVASRQAEETARLDTVPLHQVLQKAADAIRPAMEQKGLRFETHWQAPLWVRGDADKLQQAFAHVLDNALRFTPQGGWVRLTAHPKGHEAWIQIEDSGIGIPPEELEAIFDEFHQVEDHLTRHHGGLGLGLSIARNLIRLHKGRIWAESPGPGKGTRITITLPLTTPAKKAAPPGEV